jgi:iron complex outermembrane receptor protein
MSAQFVSEQNHSLVGGVARMKNRKVVVTITTLAAAVAAALQPAIAADEGGLEEIVVTARKRSEDILKTPIAVTAITGEDIAAKGIVSLTDVSNFTPGFTINSVNSGRNDRSFQQITLRGFTPSTTSATLTATFIDGVPVASATGLNAVTNPERVEILKGPQSAYFGRNTFAGAVNVVNRMPGDTFSGEATAMAGTRDNKDIAASIEGPIAGDMLSFRLAGRSFAKSGSWKNQANMSETLGDQASDNINLMLVSKPTSKLTIKVFGMLNKDKDGPSAQGQLSAWEMRANGAAANFPRTSGNSNGTLVLPSLSNCNILGYASGVNPAVEARVLRPFICGAAPSLPSGFSPAQNTAEDALLRGILADPRFRMTGMTRRGVQGYGLKGEFRHVHGNVDWEIGDTGLTLSWLGGKNWDYISELADLDNYDSSAFLNTVLNPTGNQTLRSTWDFPFLVERKNQDWSQELRLSYDKQGPFRGMIGASYLKTESEGDLVNVFSELTTQAINPTTGLRTRPSSTLNAPGRAETTGVFFSATYKFIDALSVSAEGRFQRDKINGYTGGAGARIGAAAGAKYSLTPGVYAPLDLLLTRTFDNFLPRVIVNWDVTPDMMVYASYSKGVNIGLSSFNTSFLNGSPTIVAAGDGLGLKVAVDPEKLDNYEVGLKGKFLDGKLRTSLAVYKAKWKNQLNRRSVFVFDEPPPAGTGVTQIVSGTVNSGDVDANGAELDVAYAPIKDFVITLGFAMNDSKINSFSDPNVTLLTGVFGAGFKDNQLPLSSKYSATLGLQYGGDLNFEGGGSWFVRSDTFYKDKQFVDAANLTWIKARTQTNLRAGITKGPVTFEAFVTNAFNDKNYISVAENTLLAPPFGAGPTNGFAYLNMALPELRVFGGRVRYKF